MIPVSAIATRLRDLIQSPPVRKAGSAAAVRAMRRTNATLAQSGALIRVVMQEGADKVRFTFVSAPGSSRPYQGPTPRQLLQSNLQQELVTAQREASADTVRRLRG